jgi:hypothetical protein
MRATIVLLAVLAPGLGAQTEEAPRKASIGLRLMAAPEQFGVIGRHSYELTLVDNKTAYDWKFNTTPRGAGMGVGLSFEYWLGRRTTVSLDVLYHPLNYDAVTDIYSGTDDPTTSQDERSRTTRTERTTGRIWQVPVLLHYAPSAKGGVASKLYLAAGAAFSLVNDIDTQTSFSNSDGTSSTTHDPARPAHRYTGGAVLGVGFRFVDDFNIKVTPEVRYTRWLQRLFSTEATMSPRNQLEIGLGVTF